MVSSACPLTFTSVSFSLDGVYRNPSLLLESHALIVCVEKKKKKNIPKINERHFVRGAQKQLANPNSGKGKGERRCAFSQLEGLQCQLMPAYLGLPRGHHAYRTTRILDKQNETNRGCNSDGMCNFPEPRPVHSVSPPENFTTDLFFPKGDCLQTLTSPENHLNRILFSKNGTLVVRMLV